MSSPSVDPKAQDGRRLRSAASRRRIVEAMRELIREGRIARRAEEVAARAEVGLRSVFRHFDDMDGLYREIAEIMMDEVAPILAEPPFTPDTPDVFNQMIARRARLFEKIMPFRVAADVHRHNSEFLREDHRMMNDLLRQAMREGLPASIRKDKVLVDALDAAMSFDVWRRLRQDLQLSVAQAKRVVERSVAALADGA
jgi:AcrR family transcriptional regulator